jgi:hypothetical protein
MDQNQSSNVALTSDGDHNLLDPIDQNHIAALGTMLIGTTQVLLGMVILPSASGYALTFWSSLFLVGGGWSLIGIGFNVFRGREAFDDGWVESDRVDWLRVIVAFVVTVGLTAVAAFTLLT